MHCKHLTFALAPFALVLLSCAQQSSQRGFVRLNAIAYDETDVRVEGLGYVLTGETDHKSVEIAGGASFWDEAGAKKGTVEGMLAVSEFYDLDAIEISGGGRIFFADTGIVRPYGSLHGVLTALDMDAGTQFGLRAGLGSEFAIGENFFFDLNLNYLAPLVAAEDDVFGLVETEIDGVSLRVGLGVDF